MSAGGKRELILSTLFAALQALDTIESPVPVIERNPAHPLQVASVRTRPALRMFDGDEDGNEELAAPASRLPQSNLTMAPVIFGYVNGTAASIGTKANDLLSRLRAAVRDDMALLAAIGSAGMIAQRSLTTTPAKSEKVEFDFGLTLAISYQD